MAEDVEEDSGNEGEALATETTGDTSWDALDPNDGCEVSTRVHNPKAPPDHWTGSEVTPAP